jgi:hypothetical protein
VLVAKPREAGEKSGSELDVLVVGERGQPLLEQGHESVVAARTRNMIRPP